MHMLMLYDMSLWLLSSFDLQACLYMVLQLIFIYLFSLTGLDINVIHFHTGL